MRCAYEHNTLKFIRHFLASSTLHLFIIFCLGSSLLFIRLGTRPLGGSEGRWGEISREMIATHNWITPKINGIPYRDKPVASYWLIVLASLPTHRVTEATTRLPSALAIVLCSLFLYSIARHFWDGKTAFFASLIFLTTYPVVFWGRTANADTLTLLGTLVCVWIFLRSSHTERNMGWLYPFFIVAGITSLMKGLLGFVLPSLCVFPYLFWKDRSALFSKRFWLHFICSAAIGGCLFIIPPFLDYISTHTASSFYLIFKENIVRFFHPFDHKAPFYYYFYYIFIILAPWSLLFPLLLTVLKRYRKGLVDEGWLFFTLWFLLLFAFFSLSGSKRGYYLLPVIPAFSALLARALQFLNHLETLERRESLLIRLPIFLALIVGLLLVLIPLTPFPNHLPDVIRRELLPYAWPMGGISLLGSFVALYLIKRERILNGIGVLGIGISILYMLIFWYAAPTLADEQSVVPFCQEVTHIVRTSHSQVAIYGLADSSILYFYLASTPLPHLITPSAVHAFLVKNPHAFLIVRGENTLSSLGIPHLKIIATGGRTKKKLYLLVREW